MGSKEVSPESNPSLVGMKFMNLETSHVSDLLKDSQKKNSQLLQKAVNL